MLSKLRWIHDFVFEQSIQSVCQSSSLLADFNQSDAIQRYIGLNIPASVGVTDLILWWIQPGTSADFAFVPAAVVPPVSFNKRVENVISRKNAVTVVNLFYLILQHIAFLVTVVIRHTVHTV